MFCALVYLQNLFQAGWAPICAVAGNMRRTMFHQMRHVSTNVMTLAIGPFQRLTSAVDDDGRSTSVWALPGAKKADAELAGKVLQAAMPAWAQFTGQQLPEVGKLDALVWNGNSPWSSANMGLLWMDRFRTLWNPYFRC